MITLALDAATYRGNVAVLEGERVLIANAAAMRGREAERLLPAVADALTQLGMTPAHISRIVCGAGPGSFTSLRIAASIAKGMAVGLSVPLFAVSSLALIIAANVRDGLPAPRRYLAALDALRGESYITEFEYASGAVRPLGPVRRVPSAEVHDIAAAVQARAVGPEQADAWEPHARGVALLEGVLASAGPVDVPSWEPEYGRLAEAQVKWETVHSRTLPR